MSTPWVQLFWSNSGNFPAGSFAWSGQPLVLVPSGTNFTPNTFPAAEEFNYLFGNIVQDLNHLREQDSTIIAQNWPFNSLQNVINVAGPFGGVVKDTNETITAACFDPDFRQYRIFTTVHYSNYSGGSPGQEIAMYQTSDNGSLWSARLANPFASSGPPQIIQRANTGVMGCAAQSGKILLSTYDGGAAAGANNVIFQYYNGTSWSNTAESFRGPHRNVFWFNNLWVVVDGHFDATAGTLPSIYTSPDGTTWTQRTASNTSGGVGRAQSMVAYCNGSMIVALPSGLDVGTGTLSGIYTTNGTTWNDFQIGNTSPFTTLFGSIAFDAVNNQWVAWSHDAVLGLNYWWTSQTGISGWTTAVSIHNYTSAGNTNPHFVTGLAAIAGSYVAIDDLSNILFSPSGGTWYRARIGQLLIPTDTTSGALTIFRVPTLLPDAPNGDTPTRLMAFNGTNALFSLASGTPQTNIV